MEHLKSLEACKNSINSEKSLTILDTIQNCNYLKIKEAMHIKWEQPTLNQQVTYAKWL